MDRLEELKEKPEWEVWRDAEVLWLIDEVDRLREIEEGWRDYWLHDQACDECRRVKRLGQACWPQVERFGKLWEMTSGLGDHASAVGRDV